MVFCQNDNPGCVMKYPVQDLVVRSVGPTQMPSGPVYAALIEHTPTGNPLVAVYTDDKAVADSLAQSLAIGLQKSLILEIP